MPQLKYGFLFNHDEVHQVAHIAPIMLALRKTDPESTITALVSSVAQAEAIEHIVKGANSKNIDIELLELPARLQRFSRSLNKVLPAQRIMVLQRFSSYFSTFDCLVVPEMTSTLLKTMFKMNNTPLILFPHGAGDRAVGFGKEIKRFDYVLLAGSKIRDRMLRQKLIRPDNHQVVGYPKFDAVEAFGCKRKKFFDNNNLTVVYNPHFDAKLSSWYRFGADILEFFAARPQLNLILAPHVMLFKKRAHVSLQSQSIRLTKTIPAKYFDLPNIHIDTGSSRSVDMSYTLAADVYLGDVSSQVYEFLIQPRPCVFLNSHAAKWENNSNYKHWNLGTVVDSVTALDSLLNSYPVAFHDHFIERQLDAIRETFDSKEISASSRAAAAIQHYIQEHPGIKQSPSRTPIRKPARVQFAYDTRTAGLLN